MTPNGLHHVVQQQTCVAAWGVPVIQHSRLPSRQATRAKVLYYMALYASKQDPAGSLAIEDAVYG